MEYDFRFGRMTWLVALLAGGLIGTAILLASWWGMGEEWHDEYYVPMLGYYVMLSICQSHYFKVRPGPRWTGMARQWVSVTGAVFIFYVHQFLMGDVIGIPDDLVMAGQFIFIVLGFFFFGMDDFLFKGKLASWLRLDAWKAVFWYLVVWLMWFLLFAAPWGLSGALGSFNPTRFFWFLASFQWVIMMQMMIAITWRDYLETVNFGSDIRRGVGLLAFALAAGFAIAYLCYLIVSQAGPEIAVPDRWHHVLYMGTYPLIPIIMFGVYSNHFNHISDIGRRTALRTAWVFTWVVLGYIIFRFLIAPSGIFGEHHWWHHFDLVFNFTVSIIPLSHHWFCGRAGFLVPRRRQRPKQ